MDGTILEEKITHAAGAQSPLQLAKERMEELISSAGYTPVERDTIYNIRKIGAPASQPSLALTERVAELSKHC